MPETINQQRLRLIQPEMVSSLEGLLQKKTSVKDIASRWKVSPKTVYYWIYRINIPLKTIRQPVFPEKTTRQATYYHYVNMAFKKGQMTKNEKIRALNKYYQNRKRVVTTAECTYFL